MVITSDTQAKNESTGKEGPLIRIRGKLLVAVLVFILLIVYAYLGIGYIKQLKERDALSTQITWVGEMLREIPEPATDLSQQLAAAEASLAVEQNEFAREINITEVVNAILELANDCQVKAIPLVTNPWTTQKVNQHDYHVFRLNVAVEGSFSQLVSFIGKLEDGEFKTLIIKELRVSKLSNQSEEGHIPEDTIPVIAKLDLAIYTQPLSYD